MDTEMNLCRICDRPAKTTHDIFSKNAEGKQILQLIRETIPVVIYRNDPLSKVICSDCLGNVARINTFRKSCLNVVNDQKDRLTQDQNKNARLYLELLENTDEQELWMYSAPVKKSFNKETPLCTDCKTELSTPKPQKPFKKYKEAVRKTESDTSVISVNGFDLDEYEENGIGKKRKRLHLIDRSSIISDSHPKRQRIMGPKSITQPFVKTTYVETDIYNPRSLLNLTLNVINSAIVPGFKTQHFDRVTSVVEENEYICEYCYEIYPDQNDLAVHEVEHMKVRLRRVDDLELWNNSFDEADIRNKWLRDAFEDDFVFEDDEDESENLLMPLVEIGDETIAEIELIDRKPMVNGVLLSDIPKADRKMYYNKNYVVSGVKRKFCPLCRYTFKDNWAIELHYFSNACYYTCRYCGVRYNKQRAQFEDHVNEHIERGDKIAERVYASRKKNDPIPRVLNEGRSTRSATVESPKVKPLKMKQLFEKSNISSNPITPEKTGQSQAYFCRKCYKVFFKLDEFNDHTTVCTGVAETPEFAEYEEKYEPKRKYQRTTGIAVNSESPSGLNISSTGRPVRNCVRDVKYKDHLDIEIDREDRSERSERTDRPDRSSATAFKGYECTICKAVFPTIPSKNSHMRIHRNGGIEPQEPKSSNYYSNYYDDVPIKQEPLEPLVEIHESNSSHDMPANIGAVSITPIPNKRHKTAINPDIMRLVQSNPNITIRSMQQAIEPETVLTESPMDDGIRSYKCSSCSKAFTNKSNLYFHKKNHCEGSRYPCPFCKKRFGTETAYSSHIFYSHPE